MSNDTIALLQLAAAVVVMAANVVLAIFTYRYVRLTAGMLEHMRSGQAASVVIDLTFDGHSAYLNVENAGSTVATNIVFEDLSGLGWSEHNAIADLRERGISYLPAHRTMRFWLGFPNWTKVKKEGSPVRVALSYNAEGTLRRRDFVIDMMQYSGTSTNSAPEDRIVNAIEQLRDAQRNRDMFSSLMFRPAKKTCVMCAEAIPAAAKICSHCQSDQTEDSRSSDSPLDGVTEATVEQDSAAAGETVECDPPPFADDKLLNEDTGLENAAEYDCVSRESDDA